MDLINDFVVNSIIGKLRQGGTMVTGTISGDTDLLQFGDNVRITGKSFSDFDDTTYREVFNGHVLETPDYDFDSFESQAHVRLGTANYLMQGRRLQAIAFTEQASPANDHQISPTMRISSCFSHVIDDHCNFVYNATSAPDGIIHNTDIDTSDTALARLNIPASNDFWSSLVNQLGGGEEGGVQFYRPYFKRDNTLVYQPAPLFLGSPPASKGTLTKEHLRGRIRVTVRNAKASERTGQVEIVAVKSTNDTLTAKYPTLQPADGNLVIKNRGIYADTQARVDTLAQNLYEWLTRPYTLTVDVDPGLILFGDDGNGLDLGDKLAVTYDGPTEDTATGAGVHLNLSAQAFWVYGYEVRYDVQSKTAFGTLELEADN